MTIRKSSEDAHKLASNGGIPTMHSGVPGFDAVLGGGLPEFSFNLITGSAGSGKTTLAQQIMFANATAARPALYFTVLGEPTIKLLRYQKEFDFFDPAALGSAVRYVNLSDEALERDLSVVLERVVHEIERAKPGIVVIDSFRTVLGRIAARSHDARTSIENFVQRLSLHLVSWEVTSFLIGDADEEERGSAAYAAADGVFWMSQVTARNSVVRKFQAVKVRGRSPMPGLHTFRITNAGIQVFPRIPEQHTKRRTSATARLSTGVPGLDAVMGGGIPVGDAVLIAGPAGSGKTTFATQFAAEGLRLGEGVVIVVFEEYPEEYLARAKARNHDIAAMIEAGNFRMIYLRPLDLSVDETLAEILEAVNEISATRVVIDSLSGFQIALAPAFREDFRESLYRLVGAFTTAGVTIFMTTEIASGYPETSFTTERVSFITDDIIVQRFVEIDGVLRTVMAIHKMRGSEHSHDFLTYEITSLGAVIGGPLRHYRGILTGVPELQPQLIQSGHDGLTDHESTVLSTLVRLGEVTRQILAEHMGVATPELDETIARLELLGYLSMATEKGVENLRAIAQGDWKKKTVP
jgi:circadian clock protein KaiC